MEFSLDVAEGKRELHDCATCKRPQPVACEVCPLALGKQPDTPEWLVFYLGLHKRVKRYSALPDPGGLLDQEEKTMRMLDMIDDVIEAREQRKNDTRQAAIEREQNRPTREWSPRQKRG